MRAGLYAYLCSKSYEDPYVLQDLTPGLVDVVVSVAQHGGIRDFEVHLNQEQFNAFTLAYRHIGKRIIVLDHMLVPLADGTIVIPSITESGNRVTCAGAFWELCFRQVYNDTSSWVDTGTSSQVIKAMLTQECPEVSSDQSNIEETDTLIHPWQTAENAYPGDLIPRFAAMSDSQYREWYFWLKVAPFNMGVPRKPIPYFRPQDLETVHFRFSRSDCPEGGLDLSPSLVGLANDVRIMFRDAAGTQRQTESASDSDSQERFWLREVWDAPISTVPETVADQYRNMYLARYKDPQQSFSFRVNGWLRDRNNKRVPLWRLIQEFPCNIAIDDLMPSFGVEGVDREQTFAVAAAQYSYARNELTITPDLEEKTMENLLALWMGVG